MAIQLVNKEWCPYVGDFRCEFVMDSEADAANLPKCCAGSVAIVANADSPAYMVNASGEWGAL